jgi:fucose permease
MSSWLTVLTLITLGTVVGGWLARRFPLDKALTLCALVATVGFIRMAATNPNTTKAWLALALAVVLGSDLLITLVRRWQTRPTA